MFLRWKQMFAGTAIPRELLTAILIDTEAVADWWAHATGLGSNCGLCCHHSSLLSPTKIYDDKIQKQISLIFQSIVINPCIVSPNIFQVLSFPAFVWRSRLSSTPQWCSVCVRLVQNRWKPIRRALWRKLSSRVSSLILACKFQVLHMNLTHWVMTSTSAAVILSPIECCRLFCGAENEIVATACGNDLSINRSFRAFCYLIGWEGWMNEACFHDVKLESIKSCSVPHAMSLRVVTAPVFLWLSIQSRVDISDTAHASLCKLARKAW